MGFLITLWEYMLAMSPYLILGLFVAGIINTFVNVETIKKVMGKKSYSAIFKAALLGIPLPLCSCSVIPTAVIIKKNGGSNAATSSFLISTPESGVDSISVTYALMDLPMTIIRPIAAFLSAMLAGTLQYFYNSDDPEVDMTEGSKKDDCECVSKKSFQHFSHRLKEVFKFSFGSLLNDIAGWLLVGILLGAVISYFIPEGVLTMANGIWGRVGILLIGVPFYICASASTPIAAAMMLKGLNPGVALIFLLVGPATNISNIMVMQKYIGKKGVIINILSIMLVAFVLSFVVDWLYTAFALPLDFKLGNMGPEHLYTNYFKMGCAVFMGLFIIKGVYVSHLRKYFSKDKDKPNSCCHQEQ